MRNEAIRAFLAAMEDAGDTYFADDTDGETDPKLAGKTAALAAAMNLHRALGGSPRDRQPLLQIWSDYLPRRTNETDANEAMKLATAAVAVEVLHKQRGDKLDAALTEVAGATGHALSKRRLRNLRRDIGAGRANAGIVEHYGRVKAIIRSYNRDASTNAGRALELVRGMYGK